jgi:hypothetical protein
MATKRAKGGCTRTRSAAQVADAPLGVGYDSIEDGHRDLIFSFLGLLEAGRAEAVSRCWRTFTAAALIWRARVLDVYPSLRGAQAAPAAPAASPSPAVLGSPAVDWKARCRGLRREQPESPAADVLASINAQYEFQVQVDFFRLAHAVAEDDDLVEPRARLARVSRASADATLVHGADAAFDMGDTATKFVVTLGSPLGVDVGGTELAQLGAEYTLLAVRRADGAVSKVLSCDCEFVRPAENGDLGSMGMQHEGGQLWGFDHQHGQLAGPAHLEHLGGLNAFGDLGDTCQWTARKCTGSHVYAFTKLTFGVWFADAQHAKCVSTAGFAMLLKLLWWT